MTLVTHSLKGIEADNMLGFLATLGCLGALEVEHPEWQARVSWCTNPLGACLHVSASASETEIAAAADAGCRRLGAAIEFDRKDVKFSLADFRSVSQNALTGSKPSLAQALAALGSDGAAKRDGENIEPTPYCLMFGQGHQHFLERLQSYLTSAEDGSAAIQEALFRPWEYEDEGESFRWDPIEDRRYAHQFGNPSESQNKLGTVAGANRLAALGFTYLSCAPRTHGLAALGATGRRQEQEFCWPLPKIPTSWAGYVALLGHPDLGDPERSRLLAPLGVTAVARARRIQSGKFLSVERARLNMLD